MAAANLKWREALAKLLAALRSQWLASTLFIPLAFLLYQNHVQRQATREDRIQSVNVDRIGKIQDSGKALDLALAAYFQSIADLGLAEHNLTMPGEFANRPVRQAQATVIERRDEARRALADHASDVQRLRGMLDAGATTRYMAALAAIEMTFEQPADINRTGVNITALSKLVVARNALVDGAMKRVG